MLFIHHQRDCITDCIYHRICIHPQRRDSHKRTLHHHVSLLRINDDMRNEHTATTLSLPVSNYVDLLVHQIGVAYFQRCDKNKE